MILEDYCSYQVAKLLKEKGFLKGVDLRITQNLSFYDNIGLHHNLNKWYDSLIQDKIDFVVAPTHQMAMRWLREKYNIYISIQPDFPSDKDYKLCWCWSANILYENCISLKGYQFYIETYEDAVEASLKYCLENLI